MSDHLPIIPANARVEDVCDHCRRAFARARGLAAVCPSCGLQNVRTGALGTARESTMLAPAAEQAVLPTAAPRKPARRTKETR